MKKKNCTELIRIVALSPKSLKALIQSSLQMAALTRGEKVHLSNPKETEETIKSESFLESVAQNFTTVFNDDELSELLSFYQSDVMEKFLSQSENLLGPLYEKIRIYIDEHIEKKGRNGVN